MKRSWTGARKRRGMELLVSGLFFATFSTLFSWGSGLWAEEYPGRSEHLVIDAPTAWPETVHHVSVYIPSQYDGKTPVGLIVLEDGLADNFPVVAERLIDEGAMPVCVIVGVSSATMTPTLPGGFERSVRCHQYDSVGPGYANFIIETVVPAVEKEYDLNLTDSPDLRLIGGCSSGGICSLNAAWERPDYFRRVFMASPSVVAFRGSESLPILIRKCETKPLVIYMNVGDRDMRNSAGDWGIAAVRLDDAFRYAGYDYLFEKLEGKHGVGYNNQAAIEKGFRFLWKDGGKPITVRALQPRAADIIEHDRPWTLSGEPMPDRPAVRIAPQDGAAPGVYRFEKNSIVFQPDSEGASRTVLEASGPITSIAQSPDKWLLYFTVDGAREFFAAPILPDGSLAASFAEGVPQLAGESREIGVRAVCADVSGRLYVGSGLGVQVFDPTGHQTAILPLPNNAPVMNLTFGGPENRTLFAESNGAVYKRPVKIAGTSPDDPIREPAGSSF